ncbi:hypothetical protein HYDPIDRAFT_43826 [Hydnomerulius pinastri MD-312]|uniref:Major facilitator superfamily (MFS) profile domain-containing protein n=1 Tax=Hydnomerulius pinastri MD-312 TaxID=994086 RepID=A0A0C9VPV3_9AGAM|nr:hypothetical protein HYDPIDRAFT_43826 [Hydnomerulius pinastri MD-312]
MDCEPCTTVDARSEKDLTTRTLAPNEEPPTVLTDPLSGAPDGGLKAWTVVLGISLKIFSSFGYVNAWGVFQAYYQDHLLQDASPSDVAWIGSLQYALVFLPGLVTGRLVDLDYFKGPCFVASCTIVACAFITAQCEKYWQFLLIQGIMTGLSSGVIFGTSLGIVSHWFTKRRGFAMAVAALGSSIGGTVFPVAAQNLLPVIGFKWTMRVFGLVLAATLGVANLAVDRRLPPVKVTGGLFNWAAFRNPVYTTYCISGLFTFLGLYTALTYMSVSAESVGVSSDFSFYLVAIVNASSAIGRLSAGLLADRYGPTNTMIPFTVAAGVMTFIWPFASSKPELIVVAVTYGITCGAYVSLLSLPVIAMGELSDVGRRVGMFLTFSAIGALGGPPASGAIYGATQGFKAVGFYAGGIVLLSAMLQAVARYLHLGQVLGKF